MKITVSILLGLLLLTFASGSVFAQRHQKLTVILLRHAEKDVSEGADTANPDLSAEGKLRAQRLVKILNEYKPDAVFSSNYIRTRETIKPFARTKRMMTQFYDPRNLKQMADLIMSGKIKRLVVVGHNNTTPALVNMLINENKYKTFPETEYDKIFVVKIKRNKKKPNKVKETIITY